MATKKTETKKASASKKNEPAKSKKEAAPIVNDETPKIRYNSLVLQEQGAKYKTLLTEKYKNRKRWEKPDLKKIKSLIPGTVIKVYVEEGQKVKEGDLMMVLEAMKMKNKIYFPMDGTVKKIYVKEEEKVPKDHLMIELK
ncbi:MAG: acetyl-CoA carboxylase biotin carboxyl carrier protein subunit [Marinilabiliales bacterium]|nr:MAG: acetyl-CoA carboxylase biotin carboxyl carrier protein subunit [Marinilabiliales bacterium]